MRGAVVRVLVLCLALSLTAGTPPAHAGVTSLAGKTVLKGDSSSRMRVRVPADAVVDLTSTAAPDGTLAPKALKTRGGSGHVGFLLIRAGRVDDLSIVAARLPHPLHNGNDVISAVGHGRPAASDAEEAMIPTGEDQPASCTRCRVPAGVYDLHLLTSGSAAVTITLEGLEGRTVLRPATTTWEHSWSSTLRPFRSGSDLWQGAGWSMGMGWGHREAGVLLTTSELILTPRQTPVVAGQVESCRSVNRYQQCDGRTVMAGTQSRWARSGAITRGNARSVFSDMSFEVAGGGTYRARMSLLWIPTARSSTTPDVGVAVPVDRLQTILPANDP